MWCLVPTEKFLSATGRTEYLGRPKGQNRMPWGIPCIYPEITQLQRIPSILYTPRTSLIVPLMASVRVQTVFGIRQDGRFSSSLVELIASSDNRAEISTKDGSPAPSVKRTEWGGTATRSDRRSLETRSLSARRAQQVTGISRRSREMPGEMVEGLEKRWGRIESRYVVLIPWRWRRISVAMFNSIVKQWAAWMTRVLVERLFNF